MGDLALTKQYIWLVAQNSISTMSFLSCGRTVTFSRRKKTSKYFVNDFRLERVWLNSQVSEKKTPCFKIRWCLNVVGLSCVSWLLLDMGEARFCFLRGLSKCAQGFHEGEDFLAVQYVCMDVIGLEHGKP